MSDKSKGILFSAPMVRAILEGRKTQTRRVIKPQPPEYVTRASFESKGWGITKEEKKNDWCFNDDAAINAWLSKCHYPAGIILYVKETFRLSESNDCACYEDCSCKIGTPIYRATSLWQRDLPSDPPWKPSIFMPLKFSRIWLQVESVKVERLNDITSNDAISEGIQMRMADDVEMWRDYSGSGEVFGPIPIASFKSLWESINGKGSWDLNPWLWCYAFKRIEKPICH